MDIRLNFGRDAGLIRDVEPVAARAMLADGRAEMAFADQLPPRVESDSDLVVKVKAVAKRKAAK